MIALKICIIKGDEGELGPLLRWVLTHLDVHIMHVCLEVGKALQTVVHCGGYFRLSIDPHPDAYLHEHPKDLCLMNLLCGLLGG